MSELQEIIGRYNLTDMLEERDLPFVSESSRQIFQPSEFLVREGDRRPVLFFILKGLVRVYYLRNDGKEITHTIRWESQFVGSNDILFHQQPSRFYIQALESTEVLMSDYSNVLKTVEQNTNLLSIRNAILENMLKHCLKRVESFTLLTPKERYLELLEENPSLFNRVSDKYLATILGVTPVSFSRIKGRVMRESKC